MSMSLWKEPSYDVMNQFLIVLDRMADRKIDSMPQICANCGKKCQHIYFYVYRPNRASVWVWCSNCHAYVHLTARPSTWWENLAYPDIRAAKFSLDAMDEAKDAIDQHINRLLADKTN